MKYIFLAVVCFFVANSALAQTSGTVSNHAFAIGKGAGTTGYTSLLCSSGQLAIGSSTDPTCRTMSGAATLSATGVLSLVTARTKLLANQTLFVNPSSGSTANCNGQTCQPGSLANDCLSIALPCLTLQQATNIAMALDVNGFAVTVQLSDGTYTSGTYIDGPIIGGGRSQAGGATVYPLLFNGNNSTPANVIVNTATDACFLATNYAEVALTNMLLRCVYDVYALLHGKIFVQGGVITDGVAVVGSIHYYASRFGYIELNGANFARGAGTPDALFQSTHHGNIRLGVSGSPTVTLQANITVAIASAYALTQAEITATAGFVFVPGAFAITGICWQISDASIQWSGGSRVCNNATGFLGSVAGVMSGGFGSFYTTGGSATFTPAIAFGGASVGVTYTIQSASYQWSGSLVCIQIDLLTSNKGSSVGAVTITGLPKAANALNQSLSVFNVTGLTFTGMLMTFITGGSSVINVYQNNAGTATALTNTNVSNATDFRISGCYFVG